MLENDNAKISALWLIATYHDSVALVVPNVLRAMGVKIANESPLVKLQLCILAEKSIKYFQNTDGEHGKVSKIILGPLTELVEYIFAVCGKDELVGDAVRVIGERGLNIDQVIAFEDEDEQIVDGSNHIHSGVFVNDPMQYLRPERDVVTEVEQRDENEKQEVLNARNMSSDQSALNRTSAKVLVPSSVKPITTLEDLDLFFSIQEPSGIDVKQDPKETESPVKATIDLTDLC